ncbi:MAG: cytochrome c-type biosis protein DsbD, protein-disulfide reductase [Chitinophagaceae bacterium]|nr:cytochrome c-type biosis protein DsbD, protein-disulfide reductase [Chitinophagaceae bacterium]
MKKLLLTLLAGIFFIYYSTAQEQKPVQFSFTSERVNDSVQRVIIKAVIAKGTLLLTTQKQKPDEAFYTDIQPDSASVRLLTSHDVIEQGKLVSKPDSTAGTLRGYTDSVNFILSFHIGKKDSVNLKGVITWLAKTNTEFLNGEENFAVKIVPARQVLSPAKIPLKPGQSLRTIFLICFAAGLLAVITPCVFPLIPVTVSFFLKRSKTRQEGIRNALWYSLSIILIYTIPTLLLTLIFGDKVLYHISTSAVSNLIFFLIFIVFAISFFGAFELTLPNSWANKADGKAGKGGLTGIFFMALTLVIVSFSCTGPIVGTLLGQTSSQGLSLAPVLGMLGFSLGLALPFSLFAFFPSLLQSLPRSGGWLNSVKVCFGFIELALALKFLSNVDLIYHWRLLDREVFLVLWIVIAFLLSLYLLGKLKFSHDSDLPYISIPRLFFAIATLSFGLYLLPGLWGAPLKALSGLVPPATTQDFNLSTIQFSSTPVASSSSHAKPPVRYTDILHAPLGLTAYFDLDEGLAAAQALNKPVMLDFTGHSCANCRKMEEYVWSDTAVLNRIKNDFVLVSLYVDEETALPENEQSVNSRGEKATTVGNKNLDYEITKFGFNAQPLYMFLDLKGEPLSDIKYGYDSDKEKFIRHMKKVKAEFLKRK